MPFRDAYRKIAKIADDLPPVDPDAALRERTHLGASGNLGLEHLERWIAEDANRRTAARCLRGRDYALVARAEQGV